MKKVLSSLLLLSAFFVWSCGNNADNETDDDTSSLNNNIDTSSINNTAGAAAPLNEADRMFVMDAAMANTMEVESANIAQQNASSQRVKDYAAMMLRDHTAAGNELKSLASSRNVMVADTVSSEMRNHMEEMKKMKGKAFDNHYMKMMVDDHQKTISKFENASNTAADPDLKNWATQKLPTLRAHLDSAKAIQGKM